MASLQHVWVSNMEIVEITIDKVLTETNKAVLVKIDEDELWLPKSQIELDENSNGVSIAQMPEWLAINKGLV